MDFTSTESLDERNSSIGLYSSLSGSEFRVLEIHGSSDCSASLECTLTVQPDTYSVRYTALSYFWGVSDAPTEASVNGVAVKLKSELDAALRQIRRDASGASVTVWADALCINQSDLDERSRQVCLMKSIYQNAQEVYIWLGSADDPAAGASAFDLLHAMYEETSELRLQELISQGYRRLHFQNGPLGFLDAFIERTSMPLCIDSMLTLADLFDLPWFRRSWTLQEAVLNRNTAIHFGRHSVNIPRWGWYNLIALIDLMDTCRVTSEDKNLDFQAEWHKAYTRLVDTSNIRLQGLVKAESLLMSHEAGLGYLAVRNILALSTCRGRSITDERDRVYAILGLLPESLDILPDYRKPLTEVFEDGVVSLIRHYKCLSPIVLASCVTEDLPSWVPDLRHASTASIPPIAEVRVINVFNCSKCRHFEVGDFVPGILQARGRRIGIIADLSNQLGESAPLGMESPTAGSVHEIMTICRSFLQAIIVGNYIQILFDQVLRILSCDMSMNFTTKVQSRSTGKDLQRLRTVVVSALKRPNEILTHQKQRVWAQALFQARGNRLFACESGDLGLCRADVEAGDEVWILQSLPMPCALRRQAESGIKRYQFRGCCYLDGHMDGKILDDLLHEAEQQGRRIAIEDLFEPIALT